MHLQTPKLRMRKRNSGITKIVRRMMWDQVKTSTDGSPLVSGCYLGMLSLSWLTRNHQEKQAGHYLITKTPSSSKSIPVVSLWSLCLCSKQNYNMSLFSSSFFINIWVLLKFFPSCHYFAPFLS